MLRSLTLFDRLVVGVGAHPSKEPMFSGDERISMLRDALHDLGAGARGEAILFRGLTVDAAREHGAQFIVRGLRDALDLSYEMHLASMNGKLAPDVQTVFLPASPGTGHITATLVRQIARLGGEVSPFVSPDVLLRVKDKCAL